MWTCSELKKNAWKNLSPNYWWALLLVFLYMVIISSVSSITQGFTGTISYVYSFLMTSATAGLNHNASLQEVMTVMAPMIAGIMILSFISTLIAYAVAIFLTNPLSMGVTKWFIAERTQGKMNSITDLFAAFRKGAYKRMVCGMAWKLLWTYLWSLVSIIPLLIPMVLSVLFGINANEFTVRVSVNFGISQSVALTGIITALLILFIVAMLICTMINLNRYYAYFYVPYILIDNADIDYRDTLRLSKRMSQGQKGHMFVLDLSFIGWWLLVSLSCGFLAIALYPYLYATYTELYFARKEDYGKIDELPTDDDFRMDTEKMDVEKIVIEDKISSIQEDS